MAVEVALQWCADSYSDNLLGYVNSIRTVDGGTHLDGFKAAVTRAVNAAGRKLKLLREGEALQGDYVREGLAAIISVQVVGPEFEGQTKTRLGNPHVRRAVEAFVGDKLVEAFESEQRRGWGRLLELGDKLRGVGLEQGSEPYDPLFPPEVPPPPAFLACDCRCVPLQSPRPRRR